MRKVSTTSAEPGSPSENERSTTLDRRRGRGCTSTPTCSCDTSRRPTAGSASTSRSVGSAGGVNQAARNAVASNPFSDIAGATFGDNPGEDGSAIDFRRVDGSTVDIVTLPQNGKEIRDIRGGEISSSAQQKTSIITARSDDKENVGLEQTFNILINLDISFVITWFLSEKICKIKLTI